ncbi:MAG: acid shock protein [Ruminococcus sp.]|nr:acid shock protein [Ruminococcus sp.]
MKKLLSIILAVLMLMTVFSSGFAVSAKTSVSATRIKLANVSKGIKITWNKAKGAKKYELMRKVSGTKKYSVIKKFSSFGAKSFIDKKAKAGKKYIYALKAVNGEASATSPTASMVRLTAPKNVRIIKGKRIITSSYTAYEPDSLKWNKVKGAKKYYVYRSEYKGKKWSAYKKISSSSSTHDYFYTHSGRYTRFKVAAVNGKSVSALSSAKKKILQLDSSYVIAEKTDGAVLADWETIGGVDKYQLYRSDDEGAFRLIKTLKGQNNTLYMDETVKKGTFYTYYVIGVKDKVKSEKDIDETDSSVYYDDCDYAIELGENNDFFSSVVTLLDNLTISYSNVAYESSNTDVLKTNVTTDESGLQKLSLEGVSLGYATLTGTTTMQFFDDDGPDISSASLKIRVQDTPVYLARLKTGSVGSLNRLAVPKNIRSLISLAENSLKLTSSDTSVVKVKYKDNVPYFEGVSAGEATLTLRVGVPKGYGGEYELLKNFSANFKVQVY